MYVSETTSQETIVRFRENIDMLLFLKTYILVSLTFNIIAVRNKLGFAFFFFRKLKYYNIIYLVFQSLGKN
jgi:hypothetical protein